MATVSDVENAPLSNIAYIDALLDDGPAWNYQTGDANTIYYTFSVTAGNQSNRTGQVVFSADQQTQARAAFSYIAGLTGIQFVETSNGNAAQVHLANIDIDGNDTTGLCSWSTSYGYNQGTNELTSFSAEAYVYLDNVQWSDQNSNLAAGGAGYETLLHELGHMLGLKHPFEGSVTLPAATDDTAHTLMSYTEQGGPYSVFSEYDIAAINWLYGHDGLGGALGINSTTGARYLTGSSAADSLTGTAFNDMLEGSSGNDTLGGGAGNDTLAGGTGNDVIDGGNGVDTVSQTGARSSYTITKSGTGYQVVDARAGGDGTDIVNQAETLTFSDASLSVEYDDAVQALYVAYFGRAADFSGLANFQAELVRLGAPHDFSSIAAAYDSNSGIASLIDTFGSSTESAALYSGDTRAFVTSIYNNVLSRAPLSGGLDYWAGKIDRGEMTRANAAISIMSGALSNTSAQGLIDGALVTNKITIASNFSLAMNNSTLAQAYAGAAAAATVRNMLGSISASTDVTAFQSTINSTLTSLVSSHASSSEAPAVLTLIGLADADHMLWLA